MNAEIRKLVDRFAVDIAKIVPELVRQELARALASMPRKKRS
jgi:hypothetical protein